MIKKENLPTKICFVCKKPFAWRKKWKRVWDEVKPLYDALHCHVRAKLNEHYGDEIVPKSGPLPVHMLGNMWGQSWSNVYDLIYEEETESNYIDVTKIINEKSIDEIEMVEAEVDYSSLA